MIHDIINRIEILIDFYKYNYPEIKFQINYNIMELYLNLLLKSKEYSWYGSMPLDDITPERVNLVIMDFLAKNNIEVKME